MDDAGFCGRCWLKIPRIQGLVCRVCGLPLPEGGGLCYTCRTDRPSLMIRAAVEYSGPIPPAIYRLKYGGRQTLAKVLALLLRSAWDQYPELHPVDLLVPVPLHLRNKHRRGFNQAELLARELSAHTGVPVGGDSLGRTRRTVSQYSLSRSQRRENVRGAFRWIGRNGSAAPLQGKSVLLIDDICTTASTLVECARALRGAGARSIKALVLARDL